MAANAVKLSPRQTEILRHIAAGRTNKETAAALGVAESTVEWHIGNLLVKLDASTRAEAVAIASREGLLDATDTSTGTRAGRRTVEDRIASVEVLGLRLGGILTTRRRRSR